MALNPNITRIASATDLNNAAKYGIERSSADRIAMVTDPTGERGEVVKVTLTSGDPLVASSHRQEISRDVFGSEYAFRTGGGFYWFSYMFAPEWLEKYGLLEATVPATTDYTILIQQFHPRNVDPFVHPKWYIGVSEYGVTLNKFDQSDAASTYDRVASWPVDSLIWHDVVVQVIWSDIDGLFALYLDDKLIYHYVGPTVYVGATLGCYPKQGIYAPGDYPAGITELSLYVQGFNQAYPPGPYSLCRGVDPEYTRQITAKTKGVRAVTSRTPRATATIAG